MTQPLTHLGSAEQIENREQQIATQQVKKLSARQNMLNEDNNRWEENRIMNSGVVRQMEQDLDFEDKEQKRQHILVKQINIFEDVSQNAVRQILS